jgi:hypothetical protein
MAYFELASGLFRPVPFVSLAEHLRQHERLIVVHGRSNRPPLVWLLRKL